MSSFCHACIDTTLGELTLVTNGDAVTGIYFPGHRPAPASMRLGAHVEVAADPLLVAARDQLVAYLDGVRTSFDLPLTVTGTPFQERVWTLLRDLEFGTTTTYGELAAQLGDPALARAVGAAVGRNPISIVVGCHRVLGAGGAMTGFAGGIERKTALLELEGVRLG